MRVIISPAKTMAEGSYTYASLPSFLSKTKELLTTLQSMEVEDLMHMYHCSQTIAKTNWERFQKMDLEQELMPAVWRYTGMQYKHIQASAMTEEALTWLQDHVCIPDAFYGMLRPLDGIVPYRLDFHCRPGMNLYQYWEDVPSTTLQDDILLDLAGKEHASLVLPYCNPDKVYTCVFLKNGKTHSTLAKSARGEMVKWMAENNIQTVEELKRFHALGLVYEPSLSDIHRLVFVVQ